MFQYLSQWKWSSHAKCFNSWEKNIKQEVKFITGWIIVEYGMYLSIQFENETSNMNNTDWGIYKGHK